MIYYSTHRSGAVPILARNAKSSEDLASEVYEWVKPALTPDGILSDDLQKRGMPPLLERVGRKDISIGRFFDFALARKIDVELKAEGWEPLEFKSFNRFAPFKPFKTFSERRAVAFFAE